jgi:hypothetical protein
VNTRALQTDRGQHEKGRDLLGPPPAEGGVHPAGPPPWQHRQSAAGYRGAVVDREPLTAPHLLRADPTIRWLTA